MEVRDPNDSIFDQVKRLVPLEKYFQEVHGAELRVEGNDLLSCCCVWHEEKTPSLKIYEADGSFHCYGACDFGGTIIDAVMRDQGFEQPLQAIEWINERWRLNLTVDSAYYKKFKDRVDIAKKKMSVGAAEMANPSSKVAERARKILSERGISQETWEFFELSVDRDRWRILIPIKEKGNHPIGWSGRSMVERAKCANCLKEVSAEEMFNIRALAHAQTQEDRDQPHWKNPEAVKASIRCPHCKTDGALPRNLADQYPKYKDSKDYDKSTNLYNLFEARRALYTQKDPGKRQPLLVMEGFADVWSCHEVGFPGAVAFNGNRITPQQAGMLAEAAKRLDTWVGLIPDADSTGQRKLIRNLDAIRQVAPGLDVRVLHGFEAYSAKDANDVLKDHGREALVEMLSHNWWSSTEARIRYVLDGHWDLAQQVDKVGEILANTKHRIKLDSLVPYIAERWEKDEQIVRNFIQKASGGDTSDSSKMVATIEQAHQAAYDYLQDEFAISTDYEAVNECLPGGGFRLRQLSMILGKSGTGKALPLDAKLLSPTGWVRMGDVQVGDTLVDPSTGGTTKVTGVFPQGVRKAFKVSFNDGTSTVCDPEHLWRIRRYAKDWHTASTQQIKKDMERLKGYNARHFIPLTAPVELSPPDSQSLPLDPYLMGALLGDGSMRGSTVSFVTADPEVRDRVAAAMPPGINLVHRPTELCPYGYVLIQEDYVPFSSPNSLRTTLRDLELLGLRSEDKHIPEVFKWSSAYDRLQLLRGLMDTDGTVSPTKDGNSCAVQFDSTSPRLTEDVAWLVRSLGGMARITTRKAGYRLPNGDFKRCLDRSRVGIMLPAETCPFYLSRKASRFKRSADRICRRMLSITEVEPREMQCISVDSPSALYLTDDFVVTHNTTLIINHIWQFIRRQNLPCIFFSLEQPKAQIYVTLVQVALGVSTKEAERMIKEKDSALDKVDHLFQRLTIVDNVPDEGEIIQPMTPQRIQQLIWEINLQNGEESKVVCVDHLGMIKTPVNDPAVPRGISDNDSAVSGWAMEQFFNICKQTNTFFMVLQQLGKDVKPGMPFSYDAGRGGSQQTDYCDYIICIYRPDQAEGLTEDQKTIEAGRYNFVMGKNRHGPNNITVRLEFDHKKRRIVPESERGIPAAFLPEQVTGADISVGQHHAAQEALSMQGVAPSHLRREGELEGRPAALETVTGIPGGLAPERGPEESGPALVEEDMEWYMD